MTKKNWIPLALIILVGAGALYYFNRPEELTSEKAAKLEIKESSVEGDVLYIDGEYAVVRTGRVERTSEGNYFIPYSKKLVYVSELQLTDSGENTLIKADEITNYIKVGDRAVFYGLGRVDVASEQPFKIYRVEPLKTAQ